MDGNGRIGMKSCQQTEDRENVCCKPPLPADKRNARPSSAALGGGSQVKQVELGACWTGPFLSFWQNAIPVSAPPLSALQTQPTAITGACKRRAGTLPLKSRSRTTAGEAQLLACDAAPCLSKARALLLGARSWPEALDWWTQSLDELRFLFSFCR